MVFKIILKNLQIITHIFIIFCNLKQPRIDLKLKIKSKNEEL